MNTAVTCDRYARLELVAQVVEASRVSIKDMVQRFLPILERHARTLGRITG